mmetsp:Transcript_38569/g.87715  ORF Transcript_38569/g.87715 Transcript_38569/m.87715 type:complete len:500 (+) Transcript_38569:271-1770(+)
MRRVGVVAVHPHAASFDCARHGVGLVRVARPDARAQAVDSVIGNRDCLLLRLECGHARHGAEYLLLEHLHVVGALEDRRLDVVPAAHDVVRRSACEDSRTLRRADVQVVHDAVVLRLRDLSSHHGARFQRVSCLDRLGPRDHLGHELVVDVFMHQQPGLASADLALVEREHHSTLHSLVQEVVVCVHNRLEEDIGALPAKLHRRRNAVLGGRLQNMLTRLRRACESHLRNAVARRQRLARLRAVARHDVDHTGRDRVLQELHEHHDGGGSLLGRLEHDAIAGGQGRRQLPRRHEQREIPRDDLADHTQRLLDAQRHQVGVDLSGRTFLGTDHTREVAEVVHAERKVGGHGLAHGLAVVHSLDRGQTGGVGLDDVRHLEKHVRALGHRRLGPRGAVRGVRRVQCLLDICLGATGRLDERLAIDGRDVIEVRAIRWLNELAIDVVAVLGWQAEIQCSSDGGHAASCRDGRGRGEAPTSEHGTEHRAKALLRGPGDTDVEFK